MENHIHQDIELESQVEENMEHINLIQDEKTFIKYSSLFSKGSKIC